jgi:hypothetical protein
VELGIVGGRPAKWRRKAAVARNDTTGLAAAHLVPRVPWEEVGALLPLSLAVF